MRELIILDLDGTIVDSKEFHLRTFEKALEHYGIKYDFDLGEAFGRFMGMRFDNIVKILFPNISDDMVKKIHDKKWELSKDKEFYKLLKPNEFLLNLIRKTEKPLSLFSSSRKEFAISVLEYFSIKDKFVFIVGGDDVHHGKPDPEGLYIIMENIPAEHYVFVGDTKYDEESAKKAGIKFVYVQNKQELEKIF